MWSCCSRKSQTRKPAARCTERRRDGKRKREIRGRTMEFKVRRTWLTDDRTFGHWSKRRRNYSFRFLHTTVLDYREKLREVSEHKELPRGSEAWEIKRDSMFPSRFPTRFIRRDNVWRLSRSPCINLKSDKSEERPRVTATRGAWIANRLRLPSSALGRLTVFCRGAREYCRNAREPASNDTAPIPTGFKVVETHGGVTGTWWTAAPYLAAMHPATPTRETSTGYIAAWG